MEQQVDLGGSTRRGRARDEVKSKDSLDESSDVEELGDDELEPAVTDSEDEAAMIPSPEEVLPGQDDNVDPGLRACKSLLELSELAVAGFKNGLTFTDLGKHLLKVVSKSPTPLGRWSWCIPTQPTPGTVPTHQRRGDVLPIPPWLVTKDLAGIDDNNLHWVCLLVVVLNFTYCAGWGKPIAVPIEPVLTANQVKALKSLGEAVTVNVISADPVGTLGQVTELLASKRYDYVGAPVECMDDLVAEKVAPAWPRPSEAGVQPIERYLSRETADAFKYPDRLLLPPDKMLERAPRSRVRASDEEWFKICKMGHERDMMKIVSDDLIPRDRKGHLITAVGQELSRRRR